MTKVQADEEDFTPEPEPTTRRTTRSRRAAAPAATPAPTTTRTRGRPKKNALPTPQTDPEPQPEEMDTTATQDETEQTVVKNEDASEGADITAVPEATEVQDATEVPEATVVEAAPEVPEITTQPDTPKARKSVGPRASIVNNADLAPPTPKASASPETAKIPATPLTDITSASVNTNTQLQTPATVRPIKPMEGFMDKPIDIVLKSRTMTVPFVEDTTPKSRIVLTYLILTNFKSYAGRQEVGPFHASFSSVVGPNGSGKSNVIDSLLFVFGFRASKMRQGKISALIHNSAQYPDLDHCEVAVHFQEVMDQVRVPADSPQFISIFTDKLISPVVVTLSSPIPSLSSPERRLRTIRASTTSTTRSPTSRLSRHCFATEVSIWITSVSSFCRVRSSLSRK